LHEAVVLGFGEGWLGLAFALDLARADAFTRALGVGRGACRWCYRVVR